MELKNLVFPGYVFGQSGVQGFFGEGDEYPHHSFYRYIPGFSFRNMVFVAKTVTLKPRIYPESSNTELRDGYKVKRLFPSSIWWSFPSLLKGYLLNAVGLPNPSLEKILKYGKWQKRADSFYYYKRYLDIFQISIMLMENNLEAKIKEAKEICALLNKGLWPYQHYYALQINFSCPNTGHEQAQDAEDIIAILKVFRKKMPELVLIPKFDLLVEPQTIRKLKPYCDAFCIANTLPFGKKENTYWWSRLFRKGRSPLLKHFAGKFSGGLSGAPLFPLLTEWLAKMELADPTVIIIAGGGIMKKKDIRELAEFKIVKGIALGSVAILRPWRLQGLIKFGNNIFKNKNKINHE